VSDGRGACGYQAPLFIAWQLTNRCACRCVHCCEESGPDKAWPDELPKEEALRIAAEIAGLDIPYVVFGGGEPLSSPHCWELFERLSCAGVGLKIETDGSRADPKRLASLEVRCVQVSADGAKASTHERLRPGGSFSAAVSAIEGLAREGVPVEWVFTPTRWNLSEAPDAYRLASELGCRAFIIGPLMRLGRAAAAWRELALGKQEWAECVARLREEGSGTRLSVYPWDILEEMRRRLESPQAMLLIVPDGKVKLLNALPFAPADLRRQGLAEAWEAYKKAWASAEVADFIQRCGADPSLLRHANETWEVG
jgi:MoaA/NifB/PqqE/SkfB family radical SAM enzyme